MYTGIIQAIGEVREREQTPTGARLRIDAQGWEHRPVHGESVAIDGCCLTLVDAVDGLLSFDVGHETLARTVLGGYEPGRRVHLEASATPQTLLSGHIVQGHVDGVAEVTAIDKAEQSRLRITPPPELMRFVSPKGSVCLDGVSLTVAALDTPAGWFEVALIPTTLAHTTLGDLREGDRVNFEADAMNKMIVHWLENHASVIPAQTGIQTPCA